MFSENNKANIRNHKKTFQKNKEKSKKKEEKNFNKKKVTKNFNEKFKKSLCNDHPCHTP